MLTRSLDRKSGQEVHDVLLLTKAITTVSKSRNIPRVTRLHHCTCRCHGCCCCLPVDVVVAALQPSYYLTAANPWLSSPSSCLWSVSSFALAHTWLGTWDGDRSGLVRVTVTTLELELGERRWWGGHSARRGPRW